MTKLNVDLFLSRPKNILKFFAVWLPPDNYALVHKFYLSLVLFTQFSYILFEFIYIAEVFGDLEAVSEASYLLFTQASVCYKTTVFLMNKIHLIDLIEFMECDTFKPLSEKHEKLLSLQARKIKYLCTFFLTSAITTCTLWALIPLFDDGGYRTFPFKIWMPVNPAKSPQYELGYIYQVVTIYISAFLFIAVDSVTLCMIMFGCAQLEIIMDKLEKIQNIPKSANMRTRERESILKENRKLFIACIFQHQEIVRFINKVENTYHANIFFQLSGTVAIVCIILLRMSIVEPDSVQFYSMLNYMVTMLSQLFLYCWCGNELTIRSQHLRDILYQCPWYEQDLKFNRELWIAMECMKKPIIFKAGHYIPLSRPTFVSILRSSYSFFAVLNQAKNK